MMLCCAPGSTATRQLGNGKALIQSPCRCSHENNSFDGPWMNGLLSKEVQNYPAVLDCQSERDEVSASLASLPLKVEPLMSSYSNDGTVETAALTSSTIGSCVSSEESVSRFAPLVRPVLTECSSASTEGIFRLPSKVSSNEDEDENISSMLTLKRANPIYDSEDEDDRYDDLVDDVFFSKRCRLNSSEPTGPFAPAATDFPLRMKWRVGSLLGGDSSTCTPISFEEERSQAFSPQSRELLSNYKALGSAKEFSCSAARQAVHSTSRNEAVHRVGVRTA